MSTKFESNHFTIVQYVGPALADTAVDRTRFEIGHGESYFFEIDRDRLRELRDLLNEVLHERG